MNVTALVDKTKSLSPAWLGAIAAGAGAGAAIVPGHRVVAALVGGAAVWALAVFRGACCAGCAGDEAAPTHAPEPRPAAPPAPTTWAELYHGVPIVPDAPCKGCS